jgi:hypothetical protein
MKATAALCLVAAAWLGGCATNTVRFAESITDPASGEVTETEFVQRAHVTWGSTLEEGTGAMAYSGADWKLNVGNAASQAQAGNGVETIQALVALGQMLAPLLSQPPASAAPEGDLEAQALSELVGILGDAMRNRAQQTP